MQWYQIWSCLLTALVASLTYSSAWDLLDKRQIGGLLSGLSITPSSSSSTTTTPIGSENPGSSQTPISSSSTTSSSISTTSSTTLSSTTSSTSTSSSTLSSTTTESSSVTPTSSTPSITTIPRTTIFVTQTSDGQTFTSASTDFSESVLPTQSADANTDGTSKGSSPGLSDNSKKTIIGVVVGVGGAIILAGLGFVAWRLWGKKKDGPDEHEILMAGSSAHGEKLSATSSNPFRSNLEQYHAHSGTNF